MRKSRLQRPFLHRWMGALLASLTCLCPLSTLSATSLEHIKDLGQYPVLTPTLSDRQTAKICLSNGLQAYLVSDPGALTSGAVLCVEAGHWDNPEEHLGLAHFLEHMLFLGTEKYPQEGAFQEFVDHHAGLTNAMTSFDETIYLFSVETSAFAEALDRFSQFFIAPLFNPSGVEREMHAVHQEYSNHIEDDDWRQLQIVKALATPDHPFSHFDVGSLDTLKGVTQENLQQWFYEHYSAHHMHLIVYSSLPLDTLLALVDEDFSPVPQRSTAKKMLPERLFAPSSLGQCVYVEPVRDLQRLTLFWEVPPCYLADELDTHHLEMMALILGNEGPGSLLDALKDEGLATALGASFLPLSADHGLFLVMITLTDAGLQDQQKVLGITSEAIDTFKAAGYPEYLYTERQHLDRADYQYASRPHLPFGLLPLARAMPREPLATFPEKSSIVSVYAPATMRPLWDLLSLEQSLIFVTAPSAKTGVAPEQKEPWSGACFTVRPLSSSPLPTTTAHVALPSPNPFVPDDLTLVPKKGGPLWPAPFVPALAFQQEKGTFYFLEDLQYHTPEIYFQVTLCSPSVAAHTPQDMALLELYVRMKEEQLNATLYQATMGGLSATLLPVFDGVSLVIEGHSDKSPLLLAKLLEDLLEQPLSAHFFEEEKLQLFREYTNRAESNPLGQAIEYMKHTLYAHHSLPADTAKALAEISWETLSHFAATLWDQVYAKTLLYGNLTKNEAAVLMAFIASKLQGTPYPLARHPKKEVLNIADGPWVLTYKTPRQGSAVLLLTDQNPFSFERLGAQAILSTALEQPFFHELRTRQQTGYTVTSFPLELERNLYTSYAVLSNSHEARALLSRIDLFQEDFLKELTSSSFSKERFATLKQGVLAKMHEPPPTMAAMGKTLYRLAFDERDFSWESKKVAGCQNLSLEDFLTFARATLSRKGEKKVAFLVEGDLSQAAHPPYKEVTTAELVHKVMHPPAQGPSRTTSTPSIL